MKGNLVNDKLWGFIFVILACALILQCAAASASDNSKQAQAKALFQAAYSSSAIGEKGSPPFHLKAQFRYRDSNFQVVSGSYEELWLSSDKSRVSYSVPSGSDIIGNANGQSWQKSAFLYENLTEYLIESAMSFGPQLRLGPPDKIKAVKSVASGAQQLSCVVPGKAKMDEFCFDPQSGRLVQRTDPDWNVTYQYSDYQAWGGKWYPRKIQIIQNGTPLIQISIEELAPPGQLSTSAFDPPPGADVEKIVPCTAMNSAKLLKATPPAYPESAKRAGITGVVRLYADIGKQGQIRGVEVVHSVWPALDAAAMQAVIQWRYEPAVCNGVSHEVITPIEVRFQLH
jgi:TonB family protein